STDSRPSVPRSRTVRPIASSSALTAPLRSNPAWSDAMAIVSSDMGQDGRVLGYRGEPAPIRHHMWAGGNTPRPYSRDCRFPDVRRARSFLAAPAQAAAPPWLHPAETDASLCQKRGLAGEFVVANHRTIVGKQCGDRTQRQIR